jgi:hypothetical protein
MDDAELPWNTLKLQKGNLVPLNLRKDVVFILIFVVIHVLLNHGNKSLTATGDCHLGVFNKHLVIRNDRL